MAALVYRTGFLFFLLAVLTISYSGFHKSAAAAGSSSSSLSQPESAKEIRERANRYFDQAKVQQEKGNFAKAANTYQKALKIDSTYAEAHSNLGFCYRKQKKYDEAIRSYTRAITLNPDLAAAHEYIGETYAERGQFDRAEKPLVILRTLDQEDAAELESFIAKMRADS